MSFLAIDHVQIAMPPGGEPAARKFYCDIMGLAEVEKPKALAGRGGCWFESGKVRVHLGVEADFRPAKKAHPAFEVSGLASLIIRLGAAGVPLKQDVRLTAWSGCMSRTRSAIASNSWNGSAESRAIYRFQHPKNRVFDPRFPHS